MLTFPYQILLFLTRVPYINLDLRASSDKQCA